jgi:hypothetical protein
MIRMRCLSVVLFGALATCRVLAQAGGWQTHGPRYSDVHAIAVSPEDDRVVYAGASDPVSSRSGLFVSTDGGTTWRDLAQAPSGETIAAIAVDPGNALRLLALTIGSRTAVYRTDDSGAIWFLTLELYGTGQAAVFFDTAGTGRSHVFAESGLWRSDGGPWTSVRPTLAPIDGSPANVGPLASVWPGAAGRLFATARVYQGYRGLGSGYFLLVMDEDRNWTEIGPTPCPESAGVHAAAFDPENPDAIFVASRACGGLLETLDGGRNWSVRIEDAKVAQIVAAKGLMTSYVLSAPGHQPSILHSFDSGTTWNFEAPPRAEPTRLAIGPAGRILYAATAEGVFARPIRSTREVLPREQ